MTSSPDTTDERRPCKYCITRHPAPKDSACSCTCGPFANRTQLGVEPGCPIHAPAPTPAQGDASEASAPVVGDGEVEALVPGVIADRHGEEFWFGGRICVPRRYSESLTWGGGFALNSPRGISDHQPFRQVAVLMTPAQVADREHEAWERGYDARGVDISNEGLTETTLTPNPYPRSTP